MNDRWYRFLRITCLVWSAAWGLVWGVSTATVLLGRVNSEPGYYIWYRTAALLLAWAGLFAYRAIERPRR